MLDIKGSLKNTKINKDYYIVIDELLSNAIDSYLIRKSISQEKLEPMSILIEVQYIQSKNLLNEENVQITITDNGIGFREEEIESFVTIDTSYKDRINNTKGLSKCKGLGRIQLFHYFDQIEIESTPINALNFCKKIYINTSKSEKIRETDFIIQEIENKEKPSTKIKIIGLKNDILSEIGQNIHEIFTSEMIEQHIVSSFLNKFLILKNDINGFVIKIYDGTNEKIINNELIPQSTNSKEIQVIGKGNETEVFVVNHFMIATDNKTIGMNIVALCARSTIVKNITNKYINNKTRINKEINGYFHIILISSNYLDDKVNGERSDFDISYNNTDLFPSKITWENIYECIGETIHEMLNLQKWDKNQTIENTIKKFNISTNMIQSSGIRVMFGDSEADIAKRVLGKLQESFVDEAEILSNKQNELYILDPTSSEFRDKLEEISWRQAAFSDQINQANLSQLIFKRNLTISILEAAINKKLNIQNCQTNNSLINNNESIIHNIFFPMKKDSTECNNHDIWLLNEEYVFYDYIVSDKPLSSYKYCGESIFDDSIDDEILKKLSVEFERINKKSSKKRPDIAIFGKSSTVVIIEFKSPDEFLEDHTNDLFEYANLLISKSNGKINRAIGYLIGSNVTPTKLRGYQKFANNKGWFATDLIQVNGIQVGELYSEIIFYDELVARAKDRLEAFNKKLNICR